MKKIYVVSGINSYGSDVLSVFDDIDDARNEVDRLNNLKRNIYTDYYWSEFEINKPVDTKNL